MAHNKVAAMAKGKALGMKGVKKDATIKKQGGQFGKPAHGEKSRTAAATSQMFKAAPAPKKVPGVVHPHGVAPKV